MDKELKNLLDNYENVIYGKAFPINPSTHQLHLLLDYIANLGQQVREQKEDYNKVVHEATEFESKVYELQQENQKYKEVIDKAIELLGNYKHYSIPDEKQNGDNEDLVNNALDILKEVE